jgi:G3E family GTPase
MIHPSARLILVSGFPGSGKTSFLKNTVRNPEKNRIATVVFERGRYRTNQKETGICPPAYGMSSCFLSTVNELLDGHPEYIMIETSGFTEPDTMDKLARGAVRRSGGALSFGGTICMIDTLRFPNPVGASLPVYEQVMAADCFILTKTDMAGTETVEKVTSILHHIRRGVSVYTTSSDSSIDSILADLDRTRPARENEKPAPDGTGKRLKASILIPDAPVNREQLETFLSGIVSRFYRIHGFIYVKGIGPWINVEAREDCIALTPVPREKKETLCLGLTFMWKTPRMEERDLVTQWTMVTGVNGSLIA